jgi:hypothetical protein
MGILGRRIGVRMPCLEEWEARPEVRRMREHCEAVSALVEAALAVAASDVTDDQACASLRDRLPPDDRIVADATSDLAAERTTYLDDRAYRLLIAVASRGPVAPISADARELFEAERTLGRRSLTDAFETLAALEPQLRDDVLQRWQSYESQARAFRERRRPPKERRRPTLVGATAQRCADPLLRTELASAVAFEYALVTEGGRVPDDDPTPFFEREHVWQHAVGASHLDRALHPDLRLHAPS